MSVKDRRHFRIKYPQEAYPSLVINNFAFLIQDISESGLKFLCADVIPEIDSIFAAEVQLFSGVKHQCRCKVVRVVSRSVMVNFDIEISRKILETEAQKIIDVYGKLETTKF